MDFSDLDWKSLERLRSRFLSEAPSPGPYWQDEAEIAAYDKTFGERIGWKWDAVLREVSARGWSPPRGDLLDWGCGSGIAGRRVLRHFGSERFSSLLLWDHSPEAVSFAENSARSDCPTLQVASATQPYLASDAPIALLVVSHVLNELDPKQTDELLRLAGRSTAILWVEPGTKGAGRRLSELRDRLLPSFGVVAPCTHRKGCPTLAPEKAADWCHHFATPPPEAFTDSGWVRFGRRAGIDLRSLPYSFLALDRNWARVQVGWSRVIGRPSAFKPYVRLQSCDESGLLDLELARRNNRELCKELEQAKGQLVYRWEREGAQIKSGARADNVPP